MTKPPAMRRGANERTQIGVRLSDKGVKRLAKLQASLRSELADLTGRDKPVSQSDAVEIILKRWENEK